MVPDRAWLLVLIVLCALCLQHLMRMEQYERLRTVLLRLPLAEQQVPLDLIDFLRIRH